jgi:yecA family protein
MQIPTNKYCGDEEMARMLEKAHAKISLNQVYGLFYALVSAPEVVMPSKYYNMIFSEEGGSFETVEEAQTVMNNLMALWNVLTRWNPVEDDFIYPLIKYSRDMKGLQIRVHDNHGFIDYFLKGLDLAGVKKDDFSRKESKSLSNLKEMMEICEQITELINSDRLHNIDEWNEDVDTIEIALSAAVANVHLDLKKARTGAIEEKKILSASAPSSSSKVPRNAPCPCGSGKKYKKCCGLVD